MNSELHPTDNPKIEAITSGDHRFPYLNNVFPARPEGIEAENYYRSGETTFYRPKLDRADLARIFNLTDEELIDFLEFDESLKGQIDQMIAALNELPLPVNTEWNSESDNPCPTTVRIAFARDDNWPKPDKTIQLENLTIWLNYEMNLAIWRFKGGSPGPNGYFSREGA